MMRDVSLRVGVSESPLPGVSCIPRFSRHSKCLSNKAILSSVQNFMIAIGKPARLLRAGAARHGCDECLGPQRRHRQGARVAGTCEHCDDTGLPPPAEAARRKTED